MKNLLAVLALLVPVAAHAADGCPAGGGSSLSSVLSDVAAAGDKPVRKSRVTVVKPAKSAWGRFVDQVEKAEIQVPHRPQEGPTCAINAIGMLMDYYEKETGFKAPPTTGEGSLLEKAKELGLTRTGGFYVEASATLVQQFSTHFALQHFRPGAASFEHLQSLMDKGIPVVVAYKTNDGEAHDTESLRPNTEGNSAHAMILTAIVTDEDGKTWVILRDGNKEGFYHWPKEEFEAAWKAHRGSGFFITPNKTESRAETCGVAPERGASTAAPSSTPAQTNGTATASAPRTSSIQFLQP